MEDTYLIGTIKGTHHLAGTVKVSTMYDFIDDIIGEKLILEKNEDIKLVTLKDVKGIVKGRALLDFEQVQNIEEAKKLIGYKIYVRKDLIPDYEQVQDSVIGYSVYNKGTYIGEVIDIMETAAHDILEVSGEREILIPFIDVFITKIDDDKREIYTDLIEGM
ncbi:ribosome maturation factor RimM [Caviibacter abscessus]|uniref:ribosome maturation factor RimM n=1 Tax=Caviibacter abscessus TaxID=1766719 RepID=UPI00082D1012|nr:ribosome maturation factor RimM [Caviibacter abscessus]